MNTRADGGPGSDRGEWLPWKTFVCGQRAPCSGERTKHMRGWNGSTGYTRTAGVRGRCFRAQHTFADGHTVSNAPDLFRPPKLSGTGPGQYWGGGRPGSPQGAVSFSLPSTWSHPLPKTMRSCDCDPALLSIDVCHVVAVAVAAFVAVVLSGIIKIEML